MESSDLIESRYSRIELDSAGVRVGTSAQPAGGDFYEAEFFAAIRLPLSWELGRETVLRARLDGSGGLLADEDYEAGVFRLGPVLTLRHENIPVFFDAGLRATVLTRDSFEKKDFGIPFQFTSHLGINFDFATGWGVGYRFQHMSNGGLASPNPGLNLHVLGVSHRF